MSRRATLCYSFRKEAIRSLAVAHSATATFRKECVCMCVVYNTTHDTPKLSLRAQLDGVPTGTPWNILFHADVRSVSNVWSIWTIRDVFPPDPCPQPLVAAKGKGGSDTFASEYGALLTYRFLPEGIASQLCGPKGPHSEAPRSYSRSGPKVREAQIEHRTLNPAV